MLALQPRAWGGFFGPSGVEKPFREEAGAAIVSITGALTHQPEWFWDDYGSIKERVGAALASSASRVILEFDSPGGDYHGMLETARDIRMMADRAKKPLLAYVNGMACSAGYALAAACDRIVAPEGSHVGSIGVINAIVDWTKQNEMFGVHVEVVASGKRKLDGVPDAPITSEAIAEQKRQVDALASFFFEWVAERRGLSVEQVSSMEAAIFDGRAALGMKLVDDVQRLSELLAATAAPTKSPRAAARAKAPKGPSAMTYAEILQALTELSESEDDDAQRAKDALGKLYAPEPSEDDKKDEQEKQALVSKLFKATGAKTVSAVTEEVDRWQASHSAIVERDRLEAEEKSKREAATRVDLVAEMVALGMETPGTAWADDKDGIPSKAAGPREPWASMNLDQLKARVAAMKTNPLTRSAPRPPTGGPASGAGTKTYTTRGGAIEISAREIAMIAESGKTGAELEADIQSYAENKIAMLRARGEQPTV